MPCYSIIWTIITNGDNLITALKELGYDVTTGTVQLKDIIGLNGARRINFYKNGSAAYAVRGDTTDLPIITRKYSEVGVRSWARRRGFSVVDQTENNGQVQIRLVNRRG